MSKFHRLNRSKKRYGILAAAILGAIALAAIIPVPEEKSGDGSIEGTVLAIRGYDPPVLADGGLIFVSDYQPWEPDEKLATIYLTGKMIR